MFKVIYSHRLRTEAEWIGLASFTWKSDFPETMDLGRLNGKTPLGLAPRDCHYEWEFSTYRDYCALFGDLVFPDVCTQAVTYPTPKHFVPSETAIDPADDQILRRFVDIGSLLIQPDARGYWQMTGHVVVIDLDRDRHPWLILAKEWCDNDEDDYPNTSTAPDTVIRDDRDALGILPDDKDNRTTIARFVPFSSPSNPKAAESSEQKPFLLRFGENFEFGLERPIDSDPSSQEGPSLPKVMSWFRRPDGEHVCVDGERKLYMLREWDTGKYVYPRR
ncbi:MAG: hypothetical protein L6R41_002271 [Letrouitia leprolyta]|nr:MAG: hypothetical protein L6R41_002271 [Letrouitia leprolyta]